MYTARKEMHVKKKKPQTTANIKYTNHQKLIGKTINKIRLSCDCTDWLHAKITRRAEWLLKINFF